MAQLQLFSIPGAATGKRSSFATCCCKTSQTLSTVMCLPTRFLVCKIGMGIEYIYTYETQTSQS